MIILIQLHYLINNLVILFNVFHFVQLDMIILLLLVLLIQIHNQKFNYFKYVMILFILNLLLKYKILENVIVYHFHLMIFYNLKYLFFFKYS